MSILDEIKRYASGYGFVEPWTGERGYRLFYNENLFVEKEYYEKLLDGLDAEALRTYSDPDDLELRAALGRFFGLDAENIFPGSGVDYVISVLLNLALLLGKGVVLAEPTYGMYREKAEARLLRVRRVLLRKEDFALPVMDICFVAGDGDFVIACSPNNPTGNRFRENAVLEIAERVKGLVVVDETYVEYSGGSLIKRVSEYPNLVVLRSFSKAWGLAGLRFGFAAASEDVVRALKKISEPYCVSALKRAVVLRALSLYSYVERSVEETRSVRNYMFDRMADIEGVQPYPSDANFILFRVGDSAAVKEGLAREGFLVRDVSDKPLLENCLRVTVPPRPIAEEFLDALEKVSSTAGRRDL